MKKIMSYMIILTFCVVMAKPVEVEKIATTSAVFSTPESVNYDSKSGHLFISNIDGDPTGMDGNGYISIIKKNGEIVNKKWVTGLNAPKGAGIHQNMLYVTDINKVVAIDIDSAKIVRSFSFPEAKFLNDIAIDKDGNIYISDSSPDNSVIYKLKNGHKEKWLDGPVINRPNGLLIIDEYLYFGNSGEGSIMRAELKTGKVGFVADVGSGVDGLKQDKNGNFIVSDWKGKTSLITPPDKEEILLNTSEKNINSADLEFIKEENLLYIPTFLDNRIMIYKIKY